MKKKIISRKQFFKNSELYKKKMSNNSKVQKLANQLIVHSDRIIGHTNTLG